ncbi:MAG: hypothetical protein R3D25_10255 [Geminicoccaceae bacterium]
MKTRLAGLQLELPAVPRAAQDLALPLELELAGLAALDEPFDDALAERRALVRAAVAHRVERVVDVEDPDAPAGDVDDAPPAHGNLVRVANLVLFGH